VDELVVKLTNACRHEVSLL